MSTLTFLTVLFAAALHAAWNALVKGGADQELGMAAIAGAGVLIAAAALPFVPAVGAAGWPFLAASALVHVFYFVLIAASYRAADMSQAYPLMRGAAPLLVAIVEAGVLGEHLGPFAVLGILVLCGGILALAVGAPRGRGVALALANAAVIATYTLLDGAGVRAAGAPPAYVLWVFGLSGLPFVAIVARRRARALAAHLRARWVRGLIGGAATITAYILVLWAMTRAPIAVVAALRETAILFGLAISFVCLRERFGRARLAQACAIAAGVAILRLA